MVELPSRSDRKEESWPEVSFCFNRNGRNEAQTKCRCRRKGLKCPAALECLGQMTVTIFAEQ